MKKYFLYIIGSLILLMMTACGSSGSGDTEGTTNGGSDDDANSGEEVTVTLSLAHWMPGETPQSIQYERIAELVEERSNGELVIELFPGGQLGEQRDTIEGLQA